MLQQTARRMAKPDVIVVTGPTASGKSALALALAERRNGAVINADAMQTYDAFPVLTAQPTAEERERVPHCLYGVLPLSETLSAARWRVLAEAEIGKCRGGGRLPILCGGSGLYLRALMQGFSAIPAVPAEVRDKANEDWQAMGADAFRGRLAFCRARRRHIHRARWHCERNQFRKRRGGKKGRRAHETRYVARGSTFAICSS